MCHDGPHFYSAHTGGKTVTQQLNDGEPEGPRTVMDLTIDKSMPVHNPPPRPDEPQTVHPFEKFDATGDKDFRPINMIEYAEAPDLGETVKTPEEEAAEVEEVLSAPKDSPVPESAESSTSEQTTTSESPAPSGETVPAEKDSGQLKENEPGSPTSSLPPMVGEVELPVGTKPQSEESQTPGSPAKQS